MMDFAKQNGRLTQHKMFVPDGTHQNPLLRSDLLLCLKRYMKFRTMPLGNEALKADLYPIIISQIGVSHV